MGDIPPDDGKGIRATGLLTVIRCDCGRKAASGIAKEQIWVGSTVDLLRRQRKQYQCETPRSNFQMLTEGLPAGSIPIKSRTFSDRRMDCRLPVSYETKQGGEPPFPVGASKH